MPQHPANHTGHTGHTLQENKPSKPFPLVHLEVRGQFFARCWVAVSRHQVHAPSEDTNCTQGDPVRPICSFSMSDLDMAHFTLGVSCSCVNPYYEHVWKET